MSRPDPLVERVLGLMMPLGPVAARRMFGGHGVFLDDLMFGIVARGALYLKVDAETEGTFREAGSAPLTYRRRGRTVALSYWRAPEGALEDMAALAPWAERGLAAARRTHKR